MSGPVNNGQWSLVRAHTLARAHVRVPCSTSNLGAGFDCIGLALDRYLEAWYEPAEHGLEVVREGTLAGMAVEPAEDLLAQGFVHVLARESIEPRGTLRMRSEIPVGRGLGSSAAARVAGYLLAESAIAETVFRGIAMLYAAAAEGHPDNAAPCALGGLVAVVGPLPAWAPMDAEAGPRRSSAKRGVEDPLLPGTLQLPLSAEIGWAYAAPAARISTEAARRALPASVTRAEAVDAIRRMPALLRGLETAEPALIGIGFDDRFHVPYRLPLIPGGSEAMGAGRESGAWAVTISGSGSGLIAACGRGDEAAVADAMADAFRRHDLHDPNGEVVSFALSPDRTGAQILPT
jgi:homoserine kinase